MDLEYVNLNDVSDTEVAVRMREFNYEKFKTLVRMHLSFELDLNTDEFDLPCHEIVYEDKGKLKKWSRMLKKGRHFGTSGTTGCASGVKLPASPTEGPVQHIDQGFMFHLKELKDFLLMEKNITQEGLFRKAGSISRQNELRLQIQNDKPLDLESAGYSAHDCATVFKAYLAEMPEPLLTDAHYPAHLQIAPLCLGNPLSTLSGTASLRPANAERIKRDKHLLNSIQLLVMLLPDENRSLLKEIIEMLHMVASREPANKMSAENLATLFAPHLICPRNMPPEALHFMAKKMGGIIAYMVAKGVVIFEVPSKLSTDIRAYFMERKRKKTMSPEQMLDESMSDMSTVNTVYTFVDREKTAAAHHANTTDTELAQLYAHIQSLPESSKKRRLIKQFNKQNGQGTPLQFVVMNRLKNSEASRSAKSISDSIKKHIFHKGIMSRTPKRTPAVPAMGPETPNYTLTKNPKLRVLFQSPAPGTSSANSLSNAPNTPLTTKKHPLHKSISSCSLLSTSSMAHEIDSSSSCSSDGFFLIKSNTTVSAPVSRQTSSELSPHTEVSSSVTSSSSSFLSTASTEPNQFDPICCVTPLKLISEAAKNILGNETEKKNVAWDDAHLLEIAEISNPATPVKSATSAELNSRYKSEPNLRRMLKETCDETTNENTPCAKHISLTRKLMKGVSMGNLRLPFTTPESTKRLVRSVSSSLKRRLSDEAQTARNPSYASTPKPLLEDTDNEDLDDETFEDSPGDHVDGDSSSECLANTSEADNTYSATPSYAGSEHQRLLRHYRNFELHNHTPSMLSGRRSMSPITKSTQRMPKSMQESIMTPRSRKPVMVLTTNLSAADPNQTICPADMTTHFHEQDEEQQQDLDGENPHPINSYAPRVDRSEMDLCTAGEPSCSCTIKGSEAADACEDTEALSSNFKEYLRRRSVLNATPVDSSFSSQPDDFSSSQEIDKIDESQLSTSLLYCLDGHEPAIDEDTRQADTSASDPECRDGQALYISNNARKRAASNFAERRRAELLSPNKVSATSSNKENCETTEGYMLSKKLLISEYPGETSF